MLVKRQQRQPEVAVVLVDILVEAAVVQVDILVEAAVLPVDTLAVLDAIRVVDSEVG
jgi:3-dehydroquinate dehydratase